jgi:hypothetical protein
VTMIRTTSKSGIKCRPTDRLYSFLYCNLPAVTVLIPTQATANRDEKPPGTPRRCVCDGFVVKIDWRSANLAMYSLTTFETSHNTNIAKRGHLCFPGARPPISLSSLACHFSPHNNHISTDGEEVLTRLPLAFLSHGDRC